MQDILAITIVALAAALLVRRAWQSLVRRRAGACGGCHTCSAQTLGSRQQLVTLSPRSDQSD